MKDIKTVIRDEYEKPDMYRHVSGGVYQNLSTQTFVTSLSFTLEEDEDSQYPLEDILDKYYVHCSGELFEEDDTTLTVEFEGSLREPEKNIANITEVSQLVGKRVYNLEQGDYIILVIE